MRVLIDGGYRSLAQGTGISTYARSLEAGLSALGHDVYWLSGAHVSGAPDPLSDAVHLADDRPTARGLRANLETAVNMGAGVLKATALARPLKRTGAVLARPHDLPQRLTFLSPDLFVHAHYRHMLLRQFTEVKLPEPIDVLHLTAPLPIRMQGVRTVVTLHDLVPIRLPYTTSDNKREFIDRVRTSTRYADLIITVSEASKRDIIELLDVPEDRIFVTWQASDIEPLNADERSALPRSLSRFGLTPDGYGLFVGAIEPKKNVRRLIDAFLEAHESMPLVLAGPKAWKWDNEIGDLDKRIGPDARQRVRLLGHVPHEDLRRLYAGARALIFPSLHEGFGLPALEAMRMGCPVLASQSGGLAQVCGSAALAVDPQDMTNLIAGIARILSDDGLRSDLVSAGHAQALCFTSEVYIKRLQEAYAHLT